MTGLRSALVASTAAEDGRVVILRPAETLRHAADLFLRAGQDSAAHFANRLADDCADLNGLKPGVGDALYQHWARQMSERAGKVAQL